MRLLPVSLMVAVAFGFVEVTSAGAQDAPPPQNQNRTLGRLSIEELGRIDVTSVSKHAEPATEAASAIFVITPDDLRRAGITTLPEALRLVTGAAVGRFDNHTWAISARGFNISTANKLAVFIDGRSVYTPFFSGVFWDVQDLILDDIERIEVIRGPGGTLWGANAVNGVINIITKPASATTGGLWKTGGGNDLGQMAFRYGAGLGTRGAFRVYGKYRYRAGQVFADGQDAHDPVRQGQAGFRADAQLSARTTLVTQGEFYKALVGITDRADSEVSGGNGLVRLAHTYASGAQIQVQGYYDYTWRMVPRQFAERRDTGDVDMQLRFSAGTRHDVTTGAGYRLSRGAVTPSAVYFFDPATRTSPLYSTFIQDEITLVPDRLQLTGGIKLEHNDYTGLEYQPTIRGRWTIRPQSVVWAALSRAVRTPTRFDTDLRFTAGTPFVVLQGDPAFQSETLVAREAGYRQRFGAAVSLDVAAFSNRYADLRSLEPTPGRGIPIVLQNKLLARTSGVETTVEVQASKRWQLYFGHAFLEERFTPAPGSRDASPGLNEHNDPRHQVWFRSFFNLSDQVELDAVVRRVSSLPQPAVPAYSELTLHLGWRTPRGFELAVIGDNLLHDHHPEFGGLVPREEYRRSVFAQITWMF